MSTQPGGPLGEAAAPKRKGWRRLLVVASLAGAVSLLSGGFVAGWYAKDIVQASRITEGPTVIEIPAAEAAVEQPMLDVRGMTLVDAKQALVDTGISVTGLKVVEIPWAGAPDVVVAQDPVVGELVTSELELQVSVAATMPEFVGKPRSEVVNELKRFGVEVEIREEYALDKPTGSVLDATTKVGEPLPAVVQLSVAQPGASVFLTQLRPAGGGCSTTGADIDGVHFANSLACSSGNPDPRVTVYLLNRLTRQVEGVIGVDDKRATDQRARVEFVGDGQVLAKATVGYADPAEVSFDTTGVLRLEVRVTSETRATAVLGDFLVKGAVDELTRLETRS
ncbi:MAG TPA: PASTA domain-containing protein [Arachnia sp.]|nr:PASTA domain-containing protein [Arachnia sp.]